MLNIPYMEHMGLVMCLFCSKDRPPAVHMARKLVEVVSLAKALKLLAELQWESSARVWSPSESVGH